MLLLLGLSESYAILDVLIYFDRKIHSIQYQT